MRLKELLVCGFSSLVTFTALCGIASLDSGSPCSHAATIFSTSSFFANP